MIKIKSSCTKLLTLFTSSLSLDKISPERFFDKNSSVIQAMCATASSFISLSIFVATLPEAYRVIHAEPAPAARMPAHIRIMRPISVSFPASSPSTTRFKSSEPATLQTAHIAPADSARAINFICFLIYLIISVRTSFSVFMLITMPFHSLRIWTSGTNSRVKIYFSHNPPCLPKLQRGYSGNSFKTVTKISIAGKSRFFCDFRHAIVGVGQ